MSFASYLETSLKGHWKFNELDTASWLKLILINARQQGDLPGKEQAQMESELQLLRNLKKLVEGYFAEWHKVQEYADVLFISTDYLNRVVKGLIGKTAKSNIQSRISAEARRMMLISGLS